MFELLSCGVFPFLHKFKDLHGRLYEDQDDNRYLGWFHVRLLPSAHRQCRRSCSYANNQVIRPTDERDYIGDEIDGTENVKQGQNENDGDERVVSHGHAPPLDLDKVYPSG
jgi:hypothetical protein